MVRAVRFPLSLIGLVWLAAGCSVFPGLRVLTGEAAPETQAERVVQITGLIMADKSGTTDPALIAAADRIEAATGGSVDIIEIRHDPGTDIFNVYMLFQGPGQNATPQERNDALRRAVELTWQGTLPVSQGSDLIQINILVPASVPTLDHGPSFVGQMAARFEIAREDALTYLAQRPTSLQSFVGLITDGRLQYNNPSEVGPEFYSGQPNHPLFMLAASGQGQ